MVGVGHSRRSHFLGTTPYNRTKHNRERSLSAATLQYAVQAVGAAVVMLYAQFGFQLGPGSANENTAIIRNVFSVKTAFDRYPTHCYVPAMSVEVYPAGGSVYPQQPKPNWDWSLIDYPFK